MNRTLHHRRRIVAFSLVSALATSVGAAHVSATSEPPTSPSTTAPTPTTGAVATTTAAAPTTAAPTTTAPAEVELQPLTGLPVEAGFTPRPAMVVKIDNVDAEPQSGLNEADIVFEEIVEGRATRFAAVFNST